MLLGVVAALGSTACGEITAFCLAAGAPDGVNLEVTTTPTPDGFRIQCGSARVDSSGRVSVVADSTAPAALPPRAPEPVQAGQGSAAAERRDSRG